MERMNGAKCAGLRFATTAAKVAYKLHLACESVRNVCWKHFEMYDFGERAGRGTATIEFVGMTFFEGLEYTSFSKMHVGVFVVMTYDEHFGAWKPTLVEITHTLSVGRKTDVTKEVQEAHPMVDKIMVVTHHPETRSGEYFLGNFDELQFRAVGWKSKRDGHAALDVHGSPHTSGHVVFPVFVDKAELSAEGFTFVEL